MKSLLSSALILMLSATTFADAPNAKFVGGNKSIDPSSYPYMKTSEGREGYKFAGETTNSHRVYDFYKRQAQYHLKAKDNPSLLPAYPDLDGGEFGHWGKYSMNGHKDYRWDVMDYGPAMTATYSMDNKKKFGNNLNLLLESGHTLSFNKKTGAYFSAWEGRPKFDPLRWGLVRGAGPDVNAEVFDLSPWFAAISVDGQSMRPYHGHYIYGKQVVMQYKVGDALFLENVSRMDNACFIRTVETDKNQSISAPFDLTKLKGWKIQAIKNLIIANNGEKAIVAAAKAFHHGQLSFVKPSINDSKWTANTKALKFYLWEGAAAQVNQVIASITSDQKIDSLVKWTKGGKTNWPQSFKEKVTLAKDDQAYVIDRIGVPIENPWGSMMLLSGIDFDKDGIAYVSTLMGDVWKVSGLGNGMTEVTWKRFATGLDQPFGLRVIDGLAYVVTRGNIIRLKDFNDDDEADYYDSYFSFDYAPTGHTGSFGFHVDKDKTFYLVNGGKAYIKPWNKPGKILASGLRNAMAVGASQDGLFLVGPQEGIWTPSSSVLEIHKGDYYGMGAKSNEAGKGLGTKGHKISPSLAYIPRGIDNSTGGFSFPISDRFGPLSGKNIGLSYGYGSWFQVLRNDNYDDYTRAQGTIVPLPGEFRSGVTHSQINPNDGMLYITGMQGWGNYALDDGSLERVRYTGKDLPMLEKVHGYANGVELKFSSTLKGDALSIAKNYFVQQWNYEYSPGYGSLEYSIKSLDSEGHDPLKVTSAKVLADGKSIFLEIPEILPAMQTHIYGHFETSEGKIEVNTFATLLHLDKAKAGFATPQPAQKKLTAQLRTRTKGASAKTAFTVPDRIKAGEALFKMFCMGCHGPEGKGLTNIAPNLHSDWVKGDPETLIKLLLKGLKGDITVNGKLQHFEAPMPAFGDALGDAEIASITTFLRKGWGGGKSAVSKEQVKNVRSQVKDKKDAYEANELWMKSTKKN